MIEVNDFRNAMSWLASAVNVVTTAGASGRYGFTASSVCSVSDTPATLLVCMNKSASSHGHFIDNKILTVNVLSAHQQHLSQAFSSKMSPEERFGYADWTQLKTGAPVLEDALVSFDCEIEHIQQVGSHTIFICPIVAIQQGQQQQSQQPQIQQRQGLVYFNRGYHHVGHQVEQQIGPHVARHTGQIETA